MKSPHSTISTGSRREFLWKGGGGLGGVALASLLQGAGKLEAASLVSPLASRPSPKLAPAQRVIQIFCPGGMSHVDSWDYKPELERLHGRPFDLADGKNFFSGKAGNYTKSFWEYRQHGECGRWMSSLFPRLSGCVDDMAFIHSMQSKTALHGPAMFMMNSGFILPGFPAMGAWVTYGLGSENENLPAFVVLPDPRGLPPGGVINWGAGFLPAVHQGTVLETAAGKDPITDLFPATEAAPMEGAGRDFLQNLNRSHLQQRAGNTELEARIAAYELAARLQLSAPEVTELRGETEATRRLYQLEDPDAGPFGRQCLLARRLVERGVRFVQVYCGAENTTAKKIRPNWDSHEDIVRDHGYWGAVLDSGASALLLDLKSRGLLESTLVICTTEFGRQPFAQGNNRGRDHNPGAFTAWMAGGGIKGGVSHGASDAMGWKAEVSPTYSYDLHATALHLLGIPHEKLSFYHNGISRRLTDVHGEVIHGIVT
ncbi:DUF1501 domain-containing protein [Verrucomicrobium sp. BvORR106]|uniref:DUF1501 domain-containing protein n=1 Tax=Verrucomicrobium sp. BvORR106 TaxID=1403819 RepID=UPI0006907189|nr:DUF1501 domain-containing protein [Verrucomicrobium sp. BvORR106]